MIEKFSEQVNEEVSKYEWIENLAHNSLFDA